jgi:hypothetical protein
VTKREIEKQKIINLLKNRICSNCAFNSPINRCQQPDSAGQWYTVEWPKTLSCERWRSKNDWKPLEIDDVQKLIEESGKLIKQYEKTKKKWGV